MWVRWSLLKALVDECYNLFPEKAKAGAFDFKSLHAWRIGNPHDEGFLAERAVEVQAILRWSISQTDTSAGPPSEAKPMDPEKRAFLEKVMSEMVENGGKSMKDLVEVGTPAPAPCSRARLAREAGAVPGTCAADGQRTTGPLSGGCRASAHSHSYGGSFAKPWVCAVWLTRSHTGRSGWLKHLQRGATLLCLAAH